MLIGSGTKANKLEAVKLLCTAALFHGRTSVGLGLLIDNQISKYKSRNSLSHHFLRGTFHRACITGRSITEDQQSESRPHVIE